MEAKVERKVKRSWSQEEQEARQGLHLGMVELCQAPVNQLQLPVLVIDLQPIGTKSKNGSTCVPTSARGNKRRRRQASKQGNTTKRADKEKSRGQNREGSVTQREKERRSKKRAHPRMAKLTGGRKH